MSGAYITTCGEREREGRSGETFKRFLRGRVRVYIRARERMNGFAAYIVVPSRNSSRKRVAAVYARWLL